jgi:tRNA A-37 threonylcarbamoyl transferase component Bud32
MSMFAAGSTIGRRYRLTSLIGEGGMASVWRAEDETLRRAVAIKLLYVAPSRDPEAVVEQFLREARIAAAVQHRNVIHTVDFGTTDEGVPYIVMELLHGESLAERMERQPPLRMDEMVRLAEVTLRGLSAVHEAGIVHRDLKPQNIFLERDGDASFPKILDFGISRSLGATGELASPVMTQQGVVIGTPHYMAPEQARGEAEIDKRADIYSMGAILYEGLTGRVPFDAGTSAELLVKLMTTEPEPLRALRPDVPEVVAECVAQAMAHDREQRFVDAKAFRSALEHAADRAFGEQRGKRSSELPAVAQAPVVKPRPASSAWGDFEGLAEREPRAIEVSQPDAGVANDVRVAPLTAAQVRGGAGESLPLPAAGGAARGSRGESLPLPVAGGAGRGARGESPALHGADRASGPQARAPSAPQPRVGAEARRGSEERASMPRVGAEARRGSEERASMPRGAGERRRVSAARAPAVSSPDIQALDELPGLNAQGALQDDFLLGDNPLDAFSNDGSAALELQVEPPRAAPSKRSPLPAATVDARRKLGIASAASSDRMIGREVRSSRAIWIVPGLLLFLLCLFLIAPGLVSRAPPDDNAVRAREAQNPATRGSSRTLQKPPARDLRGVSPALRELMD